MSPEQVVTIMQITFAISVAQFVVICIGLVFAIKLRASTKRMIEWMKYYRGERDTPP